MSAIELALEAKRYGARFRYKDGRITADCLHRLPAALRDALERRLGDVLAVVAEQSIPCDVRASDVVDAARRIAAEGGRLVS